MTQTQTYWKRVVALLFFGWVIIWMYRTMLTPVYDRIQLTVGPQSGMAMGLISSCYFFGYVLMQIPGGMLMDRFGKRNVLTPGFVLFGLGIIAIGLSRSIHALYAGSALAGVASGAYYSGAFSISAKTVPPEHRFLATAIVNNGCSFGILGGLLLGTTVVKGWGMPWQWTCFLVAAMALGIAPAFWHILRGDILQPIQNDNHAGNRAKGNMAALFSIEHISAYLFYFATCYGYYMVITWLPSYLEAEKNLTGSVLWLASSIVAVAAIPGSLVIGRTLDRFSKHKIAMLVVLQIWAAIMLALITRIHSLPLLVLALAIYGLTGKLALDPIILPYMVDLNKGELLSTGLGVFNFFSMSASILAPFLTGLILDWTGSRASGFYLTAALLCASSLVFLLVNSIKVKQQKGVNADGYTQ